MITTTIDNRPAKIVFGFLAAALALLWAELFLTATSDSPNTWVGVVSSTAVLAVAGVLAFALAALAARAPRAAGIGSVVAAALFLVPFWAGGAIVLGVTAYVLNRGQRDRLALLGAGLAALQSLYLLVSIVIDFAPGLPA